jgi:hypothetical protein
MSGLAISSRRKIGLGVGVAAATVLALGLAPAVAGHAAAPAAKAHVSFGAHVTKHTQPSNAFSPQPCQPQPVACSRVMTEARNRPNPDTDEIAPKTGTIGHLKIVAGSPGKFRLQIVKVKPNAQKAKLVRNGPVIHYNGQNPTGQDNGPPYTVESFKVKVPVKKGEYLAVKATKISFEYCSGGSNGQITFEPPLAKSSHFRHTNDRDDCLMLLEAVYK